MEAPCFDELVVGQVFDGAPALTLTDGHAAVHQAILGDRLRLPLDAELCARVIGDGARLAHPGLVWDVAIGQSTVVTRRVIANLFYRGLVFRRAPCIGDTLHTSVEVVGLRQNSRRPGRPLTGLAALRVTTVDQEGRRVLDFWRCAMLPLRDQELETGHLDDLDQVGQEVDPVDPLSLAAAVRGWRLDRYQAAVADTAVGVLAPGRRWDAIGGDVVSGAPELARLSLNVAVAHLDRSVASDGRRLVYGGHTIGLVGSQVVRELPDLVTIVAWQSCDHLGPVYEGDTLRTTVEIEGVEPIDGGGSLLHLRARARTFGGAAEREVLDWRLVGVVA